MKNATKFSLSLIALATLSACGGGGGSDSASNAAAPTVAACTVKVDSVIVAEFGAAAKNVNEMDCATAKTQVDTLLAQIPGKRADLIAKRDAAATPTDAAVFSANLEILAAQEAGLNAMKAQLAAEGKIDANLQAQMDKAKADLVAANDKLKAALEAQRIANLPAPVIEQPVVINPPVTQPPAVEQPPVVVNPPVTEQPPVVVNPPVTEQPPVVVNPPVVTPPATTPVKFHGVYTGNTGVVISETNGKTWILDTSAVGPDAVLGTVNEAASTDTAISITSKSLSYTHADVGVTGTYAAKQSASLVLNYQANPDINLAAHNNSLNLIFDPINDTPLVMPAGTRPGQDFYTGSHNVSFTISADGKGFTGAEDGCTYAGTFTDTGKGYNTVSITWAPGLAADAPQQCAVPNGTVGSGVVTKYGDNYLLMTDQAGLYSNIAFVVFIEPAPATTTKAAATMPTTIAAKSYMKR